MVGVISKASQVDTQYAEPVHVRTRAVPKQAGSGRTLKVKLSMSPRGDVDDGLDVRLEQHFSQLSKCEV